MKCLVIIITSILVLFLIQNCGCSHGTLDSDYHYFIEEMDVSIIYENSSVAAVNQNIVYSFPYGDSQEVVIFPVCEKTVHSILLGTPGSEREIPLLMENILINIESDSFSIREHLPDGSHQKLVYKVAEPANRFVINLQFDLIDSIVEYPGFTTYCPAINLPQYTLMKKFRLDLVIQNLTIPWPRIIMYGASLNLGSSTYYFPDAIFNSTAATHEWNLENVSYLDSPIRSEITTSPIPGLALLGSNYAGITVSVIFLTVLAELLFNVFLREERIRVFPLKVPARTNLFLILIAYVTLHLYFLPYDYYIISNGFLGMGMSWAGLPFTLLVCYWIINFSIWTTLPIINYSIGKKIAKFRTVSYSKVVLWTRNSLSTFLIVFFHLLSSINLIWTILALWSPIPPTLLFIREPEFTIISFILFCVTTLVFIRRIVKMIESEIEIFNILNSKYNAGKRYVTLRSLFDECNKKNISKKVTEIALKSLSKIDLSIAIEDDKKIYRVTKPDFRPKPLPPEIAQKILEKKIRRQSKLQKLGIPLVSIDPNDAFKNVLGGKSLSKESDNDKKGEPNG